MLDPNEYGDLERFLMWAKELTPRVSCLDVYILVDCSAEKLAVEIDRWELGDLASKLKACQQFYAAFIDCPESECEGSEIASKAEIADSVARLLNAYPTARINNPGAYFALLVDDIYSATLPNRVVVELALRELRRTYKTPPSIAVVIEAVRKCSNGDWDEICIFGFDGARMLKRAKAKLAQLQAAAVSSASQSHLEAAGHE